MAAEPKADSVLTRRYTPIYVYAPIDRISV